MKPLASPVARKPEPSAAHPARTTHAPRLPRNPGPSWGFAFLRQVDAVLPEGVYRPLRALGTGVALLGMAAQRRHSQAYLRVVLGREPTQREVFRHFFAFTEALMLKLRVSAGRPHRGVLAPGAQDFARFLASAEPAFLGTFHYAHSDLAGFLLGGQERRRVALIRQRVGNSADTERLARRYGDWVTFIWVNQDETPLLQIKEAIAADCSVALQCDRLGFSAKTACFEFLGARRRFPFTIYHLGLILERPVLLTWAEAGGAGESMVHSSPLWRPDPALDRAANLASAQAHFQAFLSVLETKLRADPYGWFNFLPLNPVVPAADNA